MIWSSALALATVLSLPAFARATATATPVAPTATPTPPSGAVLDIVLFPNPFDPSRGELTVAFPASTGASVSVFTSAGEHVADLATARVNAPAGFAAWDGRDGSGRMVTSGVYYVLAVADGTRLVGSIVVLR